MTSKTQVPVQGDGGASVKSLGKRKRSSFAGVTGGVTQHTLLYGELQQSIRTATVCHVNSMLMTLLMSWKTVTCI